MADLRVSLGDLQLSNPIIPASGTFGFGEEFSNLYDLNILGSISIKGTTLAPRLGNPTPRIAECEAGILNSVGLQNPGVESVCARELPRLASVFNKPVIANINGFSIEEFVRCTEVMNEVPNIGLLEINISCPNVHGGGMAFGISAKAAAEVTREVKKVSRKPVYIKLSPNVTDITEIARACEEAGADGLSLINTLLAMRFDLKTRRPVLANTMGGFSGPAVFPVALRMVYQVYEAVKIPIIGMGGISSAEDAIEMLLAGATAVQVGAANLINPFACKEIIEALPGVMDKYGISSITEIIGGAHNG